MNFAIHGKLDARKQTLFLSALELLMGDVKGMAGSYSNFAKANFCFSALDKLANMAGGLADRPDAETALFRALLSIKTTKRLRAAASSASLEDFQKRTLRLQLRSVIKLQCEVRDQLKQDSSERERLWWLRSLRNLRHGAFLKGDQFAKLFLDSPGQVPSEIAQATMALVLTMMMLPGEFFATAKQALSDAG